MGVDGVPAAGEIDGLVSTVDPELAPTGAARAASQRATTAMTPKTVRPRERVEVRSANVPRSCCMRAWVDPGPRSIVGFVPQRNGTAVRAAGTRWHQPTRGISLSVTTRTAQFPRCLPGRGDWGSVAPAARIPAYLSRTRCWAPMASPSSSHFRHTPPHARSVAAGRHVSPTAGGARSRTRWTGRPSTRTACAASCARTTATSWSRCTRS